MRVEPSTLTKADIPPPKTTTFGISRIEFIDSRYQFLKLGNRYFPQRKEILDSSFSMHACLGLSFLLALRKDMPPTFSPRLEENLRSSFPFALYSYTLYSMTPMNQTYIHIS